MNQPTPEQIERIRAQAERRLDNRSEDEPFSVDWLSSVERTLAWVQGKVADPLDD